MSGNLSGRYFVVLPNGELRRLPANLVEAMLWEPAAHPVAELADMRVKSADIIVELRARVPVRVVRAWFGYLSFDSRGVFDTERYGRVESAKMDTWVRQKMGPSYDDEAEPEDSSIIDAASQFLLRGGVWTPSHAISTKIYEAALGKVKVPYIKQ